LWLVDIQPFRERRSFLSATGRPDFDGCLIAVNDVCSHSFVAMFTIAHSMERGDGQQRKISVVDAVDLQKAIAILEYALARRGLYGAFTRSIK
jgi:hypothetical protein